MERLGEDPVGEQRRGRRRIGGVESGRSAGDRGGLEFAASSATQPRVVLDQLLRQRGHQATPQRALGGHEEASGQPHRGHRGALTSLTSNNLRGYRTLKFSKNRIFFCFKK